MVLRLALDTKHPKMQRNDQGLKAHIASTKLTNNHRTIIDDLIWLVKKALAKSAFFMPLFLASGRTAFIRRINIVGPYVYYLTFKTADLLFKYNDKKRGKYYVLSVYTY